MTADSVSLTIYFDTGTGKHRQLINVSALATSLRKENYSALLGLYMYSQVRIAQVHLKAKVRFFL